MFIKCTGEGLGLSLLLYVLVVAPKIRAEQNKRSEPTKCRTPADI